MNARGFGLYRRTEHPTPVVPVVLPQVDVTIDDHGTLDVRVDNAPHPADGLGRGDLGRMLNDIAADLGSAIRVDVREADGTVFVDLVTPPTDPAADAAEPPARRPASVGELAGDGFNPGEQVLVVVVVAREVADATGTARLRLPPSLLAAHRDEIVLIGTTTGIPTTTAGAA